VADDKKAETKGTDTPAVAEEAAAANSVGEEAGTADAKAPEVTKATTDEQTETSAEPEVDVAKPKSKKAAVCGIDGCIRAPHEWTPMAHVFPTAGSDIK
jgi:hypothetical protein